MISNNDLLLVLHLAYGKYFKKLYIKRSLEIIKINKQTKRKKTLPEEVQVFNSFAFADWVKLI